MITLCLFRHVRSLSIFLAAFVLCGRPIASQEPERRPWEALGRAEVPFAFHLTRDLYRQVVADLEPRSIAPNAHAIRAVVLAKLKDALPSDWQGDLDATTTAIMRKDVMPRLLKAVDEFNRRLRTGTANVRKADGCPESDSAIERIAGSPSSLQANVVAKYAYAKQALGDGVWKFSDKGGVDGESRLRYKTTPILHEMFMCNLAPYGHNDALVFEVAYKSGILSLEHSFGWRLVESLPVGPRVTTRIRPLAIIRASVSSGDGGDLFTVNDPSQARHEVVVEHPAILEVDLHAERNDGTRIDP